MWFRDQTRKSRRPALVRIMVDDSNIFICQGKRVETMARPIKISESDIKAAKQTIAGKGNEKILGAMIMVLAAVGKIQFDQIAELLGRSRAATWRLRQEFLRAAGGGPDVRHPGSGGRHRQLLSKAEETALVGSWFDLTDLVGKPKGCRIRRDLERRLGRKVGASTAYALLKRNNASAEAAETYALCNAPYKAVFGTPLSPWKPCNMEGP